MFDVTAIIDDDDKLLFDEVGIFDSGSGKWYPTLFELEQAYYEAQMYAPGDLPNPPVIEPLKIEPLKMCFTPTPVNIIGQMSYITPTLTQRLDGTWATSYGNSPIPIFDTEF